MVHVQGGCWILPKRSESLLLPSNNFGIPDLATVKLEVPDDGMFLLRHPVQKYLKNSQCFIVTVLFADDNYGNIMSVLPPERQGHKAGAGIYYHVDCECFCLLACISQH